MEWKRSYFFCRIIFFLVEFSSATRPEWSETGKCLVSLSVERCRKEQCQKLQCYTVSLSQLCTLASPSLSEHLADSLLHNCSRRHTRATQFWASLSRLRNCTLKLPALYRSKFKSIHDYLRHCIWNKWVYLYLLG